MGSDDEDDDDKKDEEKKTIKERLQAIQEVSQTVQNTIGFLASLGESVKKWVEWGFVLRCLENNQLVPSTLSQYL